MGLTYEQVKSIQNQFYQEYFRQPYNEVMSTVGIARLQGMQKKEKNIQLREGESLEDWCLSVHLRKEPPVHVTFPTEYEGVRVFYEIGGNITLA